MTKSRFDGVEGSRLCRRCDDWKSLDDFHVDRSVKDGFSYWCRPCKSEYNLAYRDKNRARLRAADRERNQTPERKATRRRYTREYIRRDPEKQKARNELKRALEKGLMTRPSSCSDCGETSDRIHGHHDDYSKPLDVIWLCAVCHSALHKARGDLIHARNGYYEKQEE